ncbi:MAG: hypothetical protein [aquatic viral metagenome]
MEKIERISLPEQLNTVCSRLSAYGDAAVPVAVETLTVEAAISSFPGLRVMAEVFYEELYGRIGDRLNLTLDQIEDALQLVLEMRVYQVRGELPPTMVNLRDVEFPSALLPLVLAIGVVDIDRVIQLRPVLVDAEGRPIRVQDWAERLPDRLKHLRALVRLLDLPEVRAELSTFPRGKDGALELYAFIVDDAGQLRTDKPTRDRVLAVLRSVLSLSMHVWVFGRPVWSYGTVTMLRREVGEFARATIRGKVRFST